MEKLPIEVQKDKKLLRAIRGAIERCLVDERLDWYSALQYHILLFL